VCPKKQILADLHEQVNQCQSTGDTVIILVDINEDIHSESITSKFRKMGLVEAVTAIHGSNGPNMHSWGQAPTTGYLYQDNLPNQLWQDITLLEKVYQVAIGHPASILRVVYHTSLSPIESPKTTMQRPQDSRMLQQGITRVHGAAPVSHLTRSSE